MSYFNILNKINVNEHTEKKNGLTYLSWAWAWGELKKQYPLSTYTVYEDSRGCNYFTDGRTCWVKTGVTVVDGEKQIEHIEYLPVMDYKNKSIPAESVTSFDVNKAIQRSLTKAVARHGLGLYIYAGEDLPEENQPEAKKAEPVTAVHINALIALLGDMGYDDGKFSAWYSEKIGKPFAGYEALTMDEYIKITTAFQKARDKRAKEAAEHGA